MANKIIDKWESIPNHVLNNDELLFNGIYIPKGAYLSVHSVDLIQFGFRGMANPRILLRNSNWDNLYELELKIKPYERVVPELDFSSAKLEFNDYGERHASRRALEGIVTGNTMDNVTIKGFDIFCLKEAGEDHYTDFEEYDGTDPVIQVKYEIDVDCAIMTKLSDGKCIYCHYNVGHEGYEVLFGTEDLILDKAYLKTHWFDYPMKDNSLREWKKRSI